MTEYYTAEKNKERMKIIKTYYLIDYENVGSEGFKGCEKLRETDIIHLFYTDNSRKIDIRAVFMYLMNLNCNAVCSVF